MSRRANSRIGLVAMLVVLSTSAAARADEQSLLVEVAKAAPQVRYYGDEVSINVRWDDVSRGDEKVAQCLAAIDAAVSGGVKLDQEFEVPAGYASGQLPYTRAVRGQRGGRIYYTKLALLKKYCAGKKAKVQLVRTYLAVREAKQTLDRISRVTNMARYQQAAMEQRVCAREVARALAMKNPPTVKFARPDVALGESQKSVCGALATALASARESIAKQADTAAFLTALEGYRRKVFEENLLHVAEVYGEGKFPLKEPAHFANVDIWYVPAPDRGKYGASAWQVTIYRFDGAKLLSAETRRGEGREPPTTAYAPAKASAESGTPLE